MRVSWVRMRDENLRMLRLRIPELDVYTLSGKLRHPQLLKFFSETQNFPCVHHQQCFCEESHSDPLRLSVTALDSEGIHWGGPSGSQRLSESNIARRVPRRC